MKKLNEIYLTSYRYVAISVIARILKEYKNKEVKSHDKLNLNEFVKEYFNK